MENAKPKRYKPERWSEERLRREWIKDRELKSRVLPVMRKKNSFSDPEASRKLRAAVKKGFLTRPEECSVCKKSQYPDGRKFKIHGHHDDYNFPLQVRWLCATCHHNWHCSNVAIAKS